MFHNRYFSKLALDKKPRGYENFLIGLMSIVLLSTILHAALLLPPTQTYAHASSIQQNSTQHKATAPRDYASELATCEKDGGTLGTSCYRQVILDIFKDEGLTSALEVTRKISNKEPGFQLYCHTMMHELGKESYTQFHQTGNLPITDQLSYCNYGFYHSFMEEMLSVQGGVAEAKKFCEFVGTQLEDNTGAVGNCYHGIGHGISSEPAEKSDPIKMLVPGLLVCRTLRLQNACATGVFNSIELLFGDPKYDLPMPANPFSICINEAFDDIEKDACYVEMAVLANDMSKGDFENALAYTEIIPLEYRAHAIQYTAVYANSQGYEHAKTVLPLCRNKVPEYIDACVVGLADGLVTYGKAVNKYDSAVAFYRENILSDTEKKTFLTNLITGNGENQQARCLLFPEDLRISPPCDSI